MIPRYRWEEEGALERELGATSQPPAVASLNFATLAAAAGGGGRGDDGYFPASWRIGAQCF